MTIEEEYKMTNRTMNNERNIYTGRHTNRARAITAMKKERARKQRIILGSVAIALNATAG